MPNSRLFIPGGDGGSGPAGPPGPPGAPGTPGTNGTNMTISNSLNFSGTLAARASSAVLYTVPAGRFAKLTLSASLGGSFAGSGLNSFLTGTVNASVDHAVNSVKTVFSVVAGSPAGPFKISLVNFGAGASPIIIPNSPLFGGSGLLYESNSNPAYTVAQVIADINNWAIANLPGVTSPILVLTNPGADGPLTQNNILDQHINLAFTSSIATALLDVAVNTVTTPPARTSSVVVSGGNQIQVVSHEAASAADYDLSVVEYSN